MRSNGRGEFRVAGVALGVDVTLMARLSGLRTLRSVATRVGAEGPARLRLDDASAVALMGRVVDKDGNPVAGARVHLRAGAAIPAARSRETTSSTSMASPC